MSAPVADADRVVGRARRTAHLAGALLRDDVTTLLVLLPLALAGCWAAGWSTPAVGIAGAAALGLVLLTSAVVVTGLVPHVAAGGRRTDVAPALLVRSSAVVAVLTGVLVAVELRHEDPPGVVSRPSVDGPVVDAVLAHAPPLALVAAVGALLGAGALRWGSGALLRLPALALPLLCFDVTTSTRGGLLLWVAVTAVTALAVHLVLRTTPLRPGAPAVRARIGTAAGLLLTRLERGAAA